MEQQRSRSWRPLGSSRWLALAILTQGTALSLPGCALFGSPPPTCKELPIEVVVKGGDVQNLNPEGQSMPVEVRVYFLDKREVFDQLGFDKLWKADEAGLGGTLMKRAVFSVFPGEEKIVPLSVSSVTTQVAVAAFFRQVDGDHWRKVVDVKKLAEACKPGQLHFQVRAELKDNWVLSAELVE